MDGDVFLISMELDPLGFITSDVSGVTKEYSMARDRARLVSGALQSCKSCWMLRYAQIRWNVFDVVLLVFRVVSSVTVKYMGMKG